MDEYDRSPYSHCPELLAKVRAARKLFDETLEYVKSYKGHDQFLTYHSRRLVEMATDLIIAYLLLRDGAHSERKLKVAAVFIARMPSQIEANRNFILTENGTLLKNYARIIGGL
jgi:hypothetical protein